tara:strand:+ start:733 stop:1104 length:372 start_codon:yes stop_codon:yes gene_type:complete
VTEPGGLDQQSIWPFAAQQLHQHRAEDRRHLTAETPSWHPLHGDVVALPDYRLVDAHLTKFIDQDCPPLTNGFAIDPMADQLALAAAEKSGDDMGGDAGQWLHDGSWLRLEDWQQMTTNKITV